MTQFSKMERHDRMEIDEENPIDSMKNDELRPYLRQILLRAGKNQTILADELMVDQGGVSRFLSGKVQNPKYLPALKKWMKGS